MKIIFYALLFLSIHAKAFNIQCESTARDEIKIRVNAIWTPGFEIRTINWFEDTYAFSASHVKPEIYNPRSPSYQAMDRFELARSWSTTSILLPKMNPKTLNFTAYYYDQGHSGSGTLILKCQRLN
jgi:hypothetical protein